jgi:hypothetical protein
MKRRLALASMALLLANACRQDEGPLPQVPALLVQHPEPPLGTELNGRLVQASGQALGRLEPQWGKFSPAIYTAKASQQAQIPEAVRAAMPAGWKEQQLDGTLRHAQLLAFSNGQKLFAAVIVEPGDTSVVPVLILRNDALGQAMKAQR